MEVKLRQNEQANIEEDYLLLDLDSVCVQGDIPANASYVLSGLDTQNPVLTIANHLKLVNQIIECMLLRFSFKIVNIITWFCTLVGSQVFEENSLCFL
ncbi:hypothetical protein IHE45_19G081400 [Dioscorea alata]|uniref:Uncharacterized protein n=1 Tax=Dioscorea alata TaxID=55571 RepID=A0ACB7TZH3_DIOAL|nr:hypothetical protein IHE45_19G081400 [Dioscorea alata]